MQIIQMALGFFLYFFIQIMDSFKALLEGTARYAGLVLAPAEAFGL